MRLCNPWNHVDLPYLLGETSVFAAHFDSRGRQGQLTRKQEEKELIKQYIEKLKPLVPLKDPLPGTKSWGGYDANRRRSFQAERREDAKKRDIIKIRRELDAYVIRYQSKKLLQLYLLAERIEKRYNGGKLQPPEPKKPPRRNKSGMWGDIVAVPGSFSSF